MLTLTPAAKLAFAAPSVTVVVPGSNATLPGARVAVIAALMVTLGTDESYDDTVAPAGMPHPEMLIELTILASGLARVRVVVAKATEAVVMEVAAANTAVAAKVRVAAAAAGFDHSSVHLCYFCAARGLGLLQV